MANVKITRLLRLFSKALVLVSIGPNKSTGGRLIAATGPLRMLCCGAKCKYLGDV